MKYLCSVPIVESFMDSGGGFRNCCAAHPQIKSNKEIFSEWWAGKSMTDFRNRLTGDQLPPECNGCAVSEKVHGHSFRTAVNDAVGTNLTLNWPSRWNIIFGNTCNLGCWTCNENSSSVIEIQKKKIGILSADFVNPEKRFANQWTTLKNDILKSYDNHEIVTLTILGGEPLFNDIVIDFLNYLTAIDLSHRTKLEFHTNATQLNKKIYQTLNKENWNYICIFLSLDAIEEKAEWLRYGSKWKNIENNVPQFKELSNYVEVHCTLSILNIMDIVPLRKFCDQHLLQLKIIAISKPEFMSLTKWDGGNNLVDRKSLEEFGYEYFFDMIGKESIEGSKSKLTSYIKQFDPVRKPLRNFDPKLADLLGI